MAILSQDVKEALAKEQDVFVWETPEFHKPERTSAWYFGLTVVTVAFLAYSIMTANFLFAFIIILSVLLILLVGNRNPRTVLVQFGEDGFVWDGRFHLYDDIEEFAVLYNPPTVKSIYLGFKSSVKPKMRISLEDQNPAEIRAFLAQYVPENLDLQSEPFSDIVGRLLKL